jgi:arylsulfatase A-like enzyme
MTALSGSSRPRSPEGRLGPLDVLVLSAWFGLAAGWLEVGTRLLLKTLIGTHRLYLMSRHFVWMVPLSNLLLFLVGGVLLAAATRLCPRPGGWLSPRLICATAILPALLVAGPQIYSWAWLIVAWGVAVRVVPWFERPKSGWRRRILLGLPCLLGLVPVVAAVVFGSDGFKQWREGARPLPPAGAPNVLLIVLDTVRADRMSLYGYQRSTTPALDRLATQGVRFAEARATAPWTLASHASMFSGYLPHQLAVQWETPLKGDFVTLAEYLGSRGYATAGFAANIEYCSYDTGLDRGFTHYEDYPLDLEHLRPLRMAVLFAGAWDGVSQLCLRLSQSRFQPALHWFLAPYRKNARAINLAFTDWLTHRQGTPRPFFVYLNYFDAHAPYLPPEGTGFRFGPGPRSLDDFYLLVEDWKTVDKSRLLPHYRRLVSDSYDNCLSYLDTQLGELFDTLQRRGVLDQTLVIVTSDHGEELGEHGLFEHGESLYRPEIRVPLVLVMPARERGRSPEVVRETVSLRGLPSTIVELAGLASGAPFPGPSLTQAWRGPSAIGDPSVRYGDGVISELSGPNPANPSRGRSPAARGSLLSLAEENYVYIRNEGDRREQLFDERADPDELVNLAKIAAMRPQLDRFRERLDRMKAQSPEAVRVARRPHAVSPSMP